MNKVIIFIVIIGAVLVGGYVAFNYSGVGGPSGSSDVVDQPVGEKPETIYTEAGYTYFGNQATGDLDADGDVDTAFIITASPGGSGTFYYLAVAFKTEAGYTSANPVLLGDRIAPQTTEIREGTIIVNFAERNPGEPMTARPSVGVSKYYIVNQAGVVTQVQGL